MRLIVLGCDVHAARVFLLAAEECAALSVVDRREPDSTKDSLIISINMSSLLPCAFIGNIVSLTLFSLQ